MKLSDVVAPSEGLPENSLLRRYRWWIVAGALVVLAVTGYFAASTERAARDFMRMGRYDLALRELGNFSHALDAAPEQAKPVAWLLGWWPGIRLSGEIAELGLLVATADGDAENQGKRLADLLRKHPDDADLLVIQAARLLRESKPAEMEKQLKDALKADPRHAEAYNLLGLARQHRDGDVQAAADSYRRAAELAPDSPQYRDNLAATLLEKGDYANAIAEYRGIHRFPLARVEEAKAHWALGRFADARARLEDAVNGLQDEAMSKELPNRRAWEFYFGDHGYRLAAPGDKRCYAALLLSVAGLLKDGKRFVPDACVGAEKKRYLRDLLADDLCRYVITPHPTAPAAKSAEALRRALGETVACAVAAER